MTLVAYDATPTSQLARYSGTCPVCGKYIAKSRSHVMRLPQAIEPQPVRYDHFESGSNGNQPGWWWNNTAYGPCDMAPRFWVHRQCYAAGLQAIAPTPKRKRVRRRSRLPVVRNAR
jgi:hypothetical protein